MSVFEIVVSICLASMFAVMAYRGVLGMFLLRMVRLPFAYVGSVMVAFAVMGLPPLQVKREEEEEQKDEAIVARDIEEPSNDDDQFGRQLFALKGMTPLDVKNSVVGMAKSGASNFDERDEEPDWIQEKESREEFLARRRQERGAA